MCSKSFSGAVNTARNGRAVPILKTSAKEAITMSASRSLSCTRRRGVKLTPEAAQELGDGLVGH